MCELFALSSKLPTLATFSLEEFSRHGGNTGPHRDGWGLAFYEDGYAQVFREAQSASTSEWMRFLKEHQHKSQCLVSHIRLATQGEPALRNTQPFSREIGGCRHVFCHNGDLSGIFDAMQLTRFKPIGETDSEYAFCCLMGEMDQLWSNGKPTLTDRVSLLGSFFDRLAELGQANFIYSDGDYLFVYANKRRQLSGKVEPPGLYYLSRHCAHDREAQSLSLAGIEISGTFCDIPQDLVLFASVPLSEEDWQPLPSNRLVVAQLGVIVSPDKFPCQESFDSTVSLSTGRAD
jgi:predicted glutamine amidotransferase